MHISWLGNTGIKLKAKPFDKEVTVVIDAYKHDKGDVPRSITADIALYTRGQKNEITISGNPFTLANAGECETKDVLITSAPSQTPGEFILRIDVERMSLGHLGLAKKQPSAANIGMLSGVDILFVPIGGTDCIDSEQAAKAVNAIEPRIVIPIAAKSDNDPDAEPVSEFVKQIGLPAPEPEKKYIVKYKNLPQEDMELVILEKE